MNVLDNFPIHQEQFSATLIHTHWLHKRKENQRTWRVKAARGGLISDLMVRTPT